MTSRTLVRLFAIAVLALATASGVMAQQRPAPADGRGDAPVAVYLLWTATCPHCAKARSYVTSLVASEPRFALRSIELTGDGVREQQFIAIIRHFRIDPPVVPVVIVGEEVFVGYDGDATSGAAIRAKAYACLVAGCADAAAPVLAAAASGRQPITQGAAEGGRTRGPTVPTSIKVPFFGEIQTSTLSLPMLTIVLAAIDGFNPCAMWVLVFLIGLLVGMNDPVRMWSYGAVFIGTSAAVYYAFMAAWLNLFLFLGSLAWIRMAVGVLALGAAAYYLREFARNPEGACPVTSPGERQGIMNRFRGLVTERSFVLAVLGIAALAVAVNMIELLCSAGIPAVYTQVLALSNLSPAGYYAYLALYIAIFMLDDGVVFVTAMLTLRASGLAATYSRYSHLVGGVVLGAVGLLLLFRPQWLSFS